MKPAIRVDNLSKLYQIGRKQSGSYRTLRESLSEAAAAPVRALRRALGRRTPEEAEPATDFWALKNIAFEVQPGEVVGIIGRNGAGKSTLLKILSRITEPTKGRVEVRGRMASLLEVGTGFHPELTGRENVYLNGSLLGMSHREIQKKFDEIVAFSEIEQFLDTAVKRYSSGMYVRLAFAVAAHLESEILIIDEVLAVGDAKFQKKCLGKMAEVSSLGRTVLFVSHSIPMILRLCARVSMLSQGKLIADGDPQLVTRRYLGCNDGTPAKRIWADAESAPGDSVARLSSIRVCNQQGKTAEQIDITEPVQVEMEYWNLQSELRPTAILHFVNEDDITLFATNDFNNSGWRHKKRCRGLVRATCHIPANFFAEGRVFVLAAIGTYNPNVVHALERDAVSFQVVDRTEGEGSRGEFTGSWPGVMRPFLDWDVVMNSPTQVD